MLNTSLLLTAALALGQTPSNDWPQWRGANRDGTSSETGLLKSWPDGGPAKVWTISGIGGGYGSPAVAGGVIYGTGKTGGDPSKKRGGGGTDVVWALNESDGKQLWSTPIGETASVGYGEGPRSTPTVAKGKVYAVLPGGDLVCLNAKDGKIVWKKNYVKDFGGSIQAWGYSESVLVDGDVVIGTPCSDSAAMVAFNASTGAVIWKAAVAKAGSAGGYSSPVKATIGGTAMYINLLGKSGGVVAVNAKSGKLLWQYTRIMNGTANIPTVIVKDDLVFCSTGYGDGGTALLKITKTGTGFEVNELKYYKANELQNHHGGMVLVGEHVYLGNGHNNGKPACVEFKTANIAWKEDQDAGGGTGSGAVSYADGMLYFHYQNGVVALVKASSSGFELAGKFTLPEKSGKASWPHPVIANGRLYIRDQDKLHAFNVRSN